MLRVASSWLQDLTDEIIPILRDGEVSQYLPVLAAAMPTDFGIAIYSEKEGLQSYGEERRFTIQSVVKVVTLLLAIERQGVQDTYARTGCDEARGPYDSTLNFDPATGRTANPFVNAGALTTLDLLAPLTAEGLVSQVLNCMRQLTGNSELRVNMSVAESEYLGSHRNRAIADYLVDHDAITHAVDELLWAYCQICSIDVNVFDLARLSYELGQDAGLKTELLDLSPSDMKAVRRVMLATGMYEASAEYASKVGIPSKCGVSGSMIAVIPGLCGIGIYGPALDRSGNSLGGVAMMSLLARKFDLG